MHFQLISSPCFLDKTNKPFLQSFHFFFWFYFDFLTLTWHGTWKWLKKGQNKAFSETEARWKTKAQFTAAPNSSPCSRPPTRSAKTINHRVWCYHLGHSLHSHLQINACGRRADSDHWHGSPLTKEIKTTEPDLYISTAATPPKGPPSPKKQTQWAKVSLGTFRFQPVPADMIAVLVNPWQYPAVTEPRVSAQPSRENKRTRTKSDYSSLLFLPPQPHLWPPQLAEYSHGNSSHSCVCTCAYIDKCMCTDRFHLERREKRIIRSKENWNNNCWLRHMMVTLFQWEVMLHIEKFNFILKKYKTTSIWEAVPILHK